jgi:hypothetical protein
VLALISQGASNRAIADVLVIDERTADRKQSRANLEVVYAFRGC